METKLYNINGEESGTIELAENIFGLPQNSDLVHQVRVGLLANRRKPVAHTKDRSMVRGGGRKPWRQKGTGRARHGSIRSPIWKGGGVAHGPSNEKDYSQKINTVMFKKAFKTVLSGKFRDGQLAVIKDFSLDKIKTREFKSLAEKISQGRMKKLLLVLPAGDKNISKSARNLGISVECAAHISFMNLLKAGQVVFTEKALRKISK